MKETPKNPILFIVGPTGAGKSKLAIRVARRLRGEIISMDSMQIYRGMDIGTDKPSRWARWRVPHHLFDLVRPDQEFSVYEYRNRFFEAAEKILGKGKTVVAVGGTGLYVKAVVDGLSPHPGKDEGIRNRLEKIAAEEGLNLLYARLQKADPGVAKRLHPNDKKRIIRALEVLELTGKSLAEWERKTIPLEAMGYGYRLFGIRTGRLALYKAIDRRVDCMFRKGMVKEAFRLRDKLSATAAQAIGYRELWGYFEGKANLVEVREKIKQHTRNFAKKQLIWFKRDSRIVWLSGTEKEMTDRIVRMAGLPGK
ncbi:MAG TPA: tRNA (adenosine(37)-N6)-dimethylallyltransferase MiaA [Candidatus Omnitrophota bacterium]|nr:tRNA (adenosine(37)-N6)-dimethylallyltransferase MiaA [Candidatus Omnitrophota bacterium]